MSPQKTYEELTRRIEALERQARDHKKVEQDLWESGQLYRAVVEHSHDGILIVDSRSRIVYANTQLGRMLGTAAENIIGDWFYNYVDEDDREKVIDRYHRRQRGEEVPARYEFRILSRDGRKRNVEINSHVIEDLPGGPHTIAQLLDITDRKQAQGALLESHRKYRTIVENIEDGYFEADLAGNLIFFNASICRILGYGEDEMRGSNYRQYMDETNAVKVLETFNRVHLTGEAVKAFDWEIIRKNGEKRYVETSVSSMSGADGKPIGFCGIVRDVSERKEYEHRLAYQAAHDALTGLYNRQAFMERLEDSLRHAKRYGAARAVLFIDIDKFKQVNDRFGHEAGDQLLIDVAGRLKQSLRETDYVCRLGGDEFTVILNNPVDTYPEIVAQRIVENVSQPYTIAGNTIEFLSASIGISTFPLDGQDVETLIQHADQAMYKAKEKGNRYICYMEIDPSRQPVPSPTTLQ